MPCRPLLEVRRQGLLFFPVVDMSDGFIHHISIVNSSVARCYRSPQVQVALRAPLKVWGEWVVRDACCVARVGGWWVGVVGGWKWVGAWVGGWMDEYVGGPMGGGWASV